MQDIKTKIIGESPSGQSDARLRWWWWLLTTGGFTVLGVMILVFAPDTSRGLSVGAIYLLGMGLSHPLIHLALRGFARLSKLPDHTEDYYGPALIGFIEAIAYPTAFLLEAPEFIGVWLAIKVAGGWQGWAVKDNGRKRFNKFLFGNALMILAGVIVAGASTYFVLD